MKEMGGGMKHSLWMIIGCALPLLLIFLLPALGVKGDITLFLVVVLIFIMHFFMMGGHRGRQGRGREEEHGHH